MPIIGKTGTSLIEVIFATLGIVVIVVSVASFVSVGSQSDVRRHRRNFAQQIAAEKVQDIMSRSYDWVPVTQTDDAFPAGNPCDCTRVNFSALESDKTMPANGESLDGSITRSGIVYSWRVCIRQVVPGPPLAPNGCPGSSPDLGGKELRVQVSWTVGATNYQVDRTALKLR